MTSRFSDSDHREQVVLDDQLPVLAKLCCGAVAGATAQSSKLRNKIMPASYSWIDEYNV